MVGSSKTPLASPPATGMESGPGETTAVPETKRARAEVGREVAEDRRESAEDSRMAGERQRRDAEDARQSAEEARQSAENARSAAEEARMSREEARVLREETSDMLHAARKLFERIEHKRNVVAAAMKAAMLAARTHIEASEEHTAALKDQEMLEAVWDILVDDPPAHSGDGVLTH